MTRQGTGGVKSRQGEGSDLPALYRRPVALTVERFGSLTLGEVADFSFSADADTVPLLADEFVIACRTLPIVFSEGDAPAPVAVVGGDRRNYCIDGGSRWDVSRYMPDYIRRYPFILSHSHAADSYVLCIDDAFVGLGKGDGEPLFVGGRPSTFTMMALEYCRQYQARHLKTMEIMDALLSLDLLVPSTAKVRTPEGGERNIGGFRAIDRERWAALGDSPLKMLWGMGALEVVFAHFVSLGNWPSVASSPRHRDAKTD